MKRPGKTLVIGSESFLGKGFYRAYCQFYPDTVGTHYRSIDPRSRIDLLAPDLSGLCLTRGEYSYALIAAANANLALCEREKGLAYRRNVEGIFALVRQLIEMEIQPILFSTSYVFDGVVGDYREDSETNPINEYGRQKEVLEKEIERICGDNYLMIRCSKVFDLVKGGNALIDQICSPLLKGETIRAAYDQVFSPIWLEDLVRAIVELQVKGCKGLYNICGREVWTRLNLAREVGQILEVPADLIEPISLDQVQSAFPMPKKTNMICEKFHRAVNFHETPLSSCIKQIKELYLGSYV